MLLIQLEKENLNVSKEATAQQQANYEAISRILN